MRKILGWYKFHLLRSFEFDRAWPWKKVYWTEMGNDDKEYEKQHGTATLIPWRKVFWLTPQMKRLYSMMFVMLGFNAFIIGLMLLLVVIHLLVAAVVG